MGGRPASSGSSTVRRPLPAGWTASAWSRARRWAWAAATSGAGSSEATASRVADSTWAVAASRSRTTVDPSAPPTQARASPTPASSASSPVACPSAATRLPRASAGLPGSGRRSCWATASSSTAASPAGSIAPSTDTARSRKLARAASAWSRNSSPATASRAWSTCCWTGSSSGPGSRAARASRTGAMASVSGWTTAAWRSKESSSERNWSRAATAGASSASGSIPATLASSSASGPPSASSASRWGAGSREARNSTTAA